MVDTPSTKPPNGGRGHRVLLTKDVAIKAIHTLVGMGVNMAYDSLRHASAFKIGMIENAEICGNEIIISGYIFGLDCPNYIEQLQASADYGMSYEIYNARVRNMHENIWTLEAVTFTGAAILLREKAAYSNSDFTLL